LRADGELVCGPGYDADSQLYVEGKIPGLLLPDNVSHADAKSAADSVLDIFAEFPFEDAKLDSSVVLAYALTLLQRQMLPTAPLFGISATSPGTGKGLRVDAVNLLVRGVDAARMPPVSGREGEDEMRKRITAFIIQGLTSLNLDNYSRPIGGDSLNALLTTTEWTDRVLGTNTTTKLPACCTLAATGNNLTVRGDMVRRSLLVKLDAGVEHPERRQFKEKNLPQRVLRDRPELLRQLFLILKGYRQSGCTDFDDDVLGRFEEWSRSVCHPIRWLGFPDPVISQERLQDIDPEKENLTRLLAAWHKVFGDSWKQPGELVTEALHGVSVQLGAPATDCDALLEALQAVASINGKIDTRRLGWYLSHHKGRVSDNRRLERADRAGLTGKHAHRYRVVALQTDSTSPLSSEAAEPVEDDDIF